MLANLTQITAQVEVDSGYVDLGNCQLFYKVYGSGEPVLFINSGRSYPLEAFEMIADSFKSDFKLIMFDERGVGRSTDHSSIEKIETSKMVQDLEALRKHLGLENWNIFGHGFGGWMAIHYTGSHPKRVRRLVLSSTPSFKSERLSREQFRQPDASELLPFEHALVHEILKEKEKPIHLQKNLGKLSLALNARHYVYNESSYERLAIWLMTYWKQDKYTMAVSSHSGIPRSNFWRFKNEVLIIHGDNDFMDISNPTSNSALFKNSRLEILEECGQAIIFDQPAKYVSLVRNFLKHGFERKSQ